MRSWFLLFVFSLCVGQAAAAPRPELRIGWTAWSDAEAVTRLAANLLENRLHQPVKLVLLDIGIQYQSLADGNIDAMLMSWQPVTHKHYLDKVGNKVVDLGPLYTRARLGWAVPAYMPADQVNSIADLKKPKVLRELHGQIYGIDPGAGLMQASEKTVKAYGLNRYNLISSSGAGMTAALARAIRRHKPIVVTAWSPHWMFARWKLRYLKDPKGTLGGREHVDALVRKGFYQDFPPEVSEFLARMYIPLDQLEAMMAEASDKGYDQAVKDYIAQHPQRVNYWVTGKCDAAAAKAPVRH
jgi:glycine betaine/proline transport system substrate-binding protein